ncbi:MAG: glycosyltransferase [Cyanobacteria bacterium HKST-UBA04]|nr:glycosyltransferase [Cyanobacteria bacterium HKST-UBA04]
MPDPCPTLSILMPVYNGAPYLAEAIDSVLSGQYQDFELLVLDNGSTDGTSDLLEALVAEVADRVKGQTKGQIKVFRQPKNMGAAAALNHLLAMARGRYIARQDADDLALPQRFEKQVAYLEAHPEVGLVGAWVREFRDGPHQQRVFGETRRLPWEPAMVAFHLVFANPVWGCSMMMRTDLAKRCGGFGAADTRCEDGWIGAKALRLANVVNLPEVLQWYRIHPTNTSSVYKTRVLEAMVDINRYTTVTVFDVEMPRSIRVMASLPLFWEQLDGLPDCPIECNEASMAQVMHYYVQVLEKIYYLYGASAYNKARLDIEGCANERLLNLMKRFPLFRRLGLTYRLRGQMTPGLGLYPLLRFVPDMYRLLGWRRHYARPSSASLCV